MTPDATLLSRRYADLLRANGCSDRTIDNYLYALKGFTRFLGERPLGETTADDIIAYQVDVAARGLSDSSVRVATSWPYSTPGPRNKRHTRTPTASSQEAGSARTASSSAGATCSRSRSCATSSRSSCSRNCGGC